jgi:hypothetical protein
VLLLLPSGLLYGQTGAKQDYSQLPLEFEESSDPVRQQTNFYDFIWRSFIALNWPNVPITIEETREGPRIVSGVRGTPDASRPLAVMSGSGKLPQAVWETYKEPFEVFPPPERWGTSGEWNSVRPPPPGVPADARRLLGFPIELTGYATDTLQPYFYPLPTGPLYDQDGGLVRYEVAVNRAFFRYVRHFGYYNAQTQIDAVNNYLAGKRDTTAFQRPPFGNPKETGPGGYLHNLPAYAQTGFIDVKAAWRVLDRNKPHQVERYLHREMVVGVNRDRKPRMELMGLVALHILRWTPNGYDPVNGVDGAFVASTFEQIDNVTTNLDRHGNLVKPTFNNGELPTPEQREFGFAGDIPKLGDGPVSVYRAAAQRIPAAVQKINEQYRTSFPVNTSVLQYYQLIGTQNHHQGPVNFATAEDRERNGHQGPITGVYTNANNLVNSALESYSQKNFSCILCHVQARPLGILPPKPKQLPTFPEKAFEDDHFKILTFLLQMAQPPASKP